MPTTLFQLENKVTTNKLTEICNIFVEQRMCVCYGDFEIKILKDGLNKYLFISNIDFIMLDAASEKIAEKLAPSMLAGSLRNSNIIYLIDNADKCKKADITYLLSLKSRIKNTNKYVLLITENLADLDIQLINAMRNFKLGEIPENTDKIQHIITQIFTAGARTAQKVVGNIHTNSEQSNTVAITIESKNPRIAVFQTLMSTEHSLGYILQLLNYNLPLFYDDPVTIQYNNNILYIANMNLYKVPTECICRYLAFGLIPSKKNRKVQFFSFKKAPNTTEKEVEKL